MDTVRFTMRMPARLMDRIRGMAIAHEWSRAKVITRILKEPFGFAPGEFSDNMRGEDESESGPEPETGANRSPI